MSNIDDAINFLTEGAIPVQDINAHVLQAIQHVVGGSVVFRDLRDLRPPTNLQKYGSLKVMLHNVIQQGDAFGIMVFHQVRRAANMTKTPSTDADNAAWLDWGNRNPLQQVLSFDSTRGHPLVTFFGFVHGIKPGVSGLYMGKNYVFDGLHPIGEFKGLDTPYEVATYAKAAIDKFYRFGGGDDDVPDETPTPDPSSSVPSPTNVPVPVVAG